MTRSPLLLLALTAIGCPAPEPKDTDTTITDTDPPDSGTPANHAPSTPSVAITPSSPADADPLTVTFLALSEDPDGDAITYRYTWARDGVVDPSLTNDQVPADATAVGETWTVSVTPNDGTVDGDPATASVLVDDGTNEPPSAPLIHIDPATPSAGDPLTLVVDTPAVDPDGDALTETIEWYVDGVHNLSWDGATGVAGNQVEGGEVYRVLFTVTDGVNPAVTAEASVTVANAAPVVESVTISPTAPEDDEELRARVRSSDPDGDALTTQYTWFRDGVEATDVGDTSTVAADFTTPGESWYVRATVSDRSTSVTVESDPVSIAVPTLVRYAHYLDATATGGADDGTWDAMTGSWQVLLQTEGTEFGHVDCDAYYDLVSTGTARCRDCAFAFDLEITYDAASSTMNTPGVCTFMEADGIGTVSMDRGGYLSFEGYGPTIGVYYYGVPYSLGGGYMYWYVEGTYTYSYPGYVMSMGATTSEDTAGNLQITAWKYLYVSY